MKGLTSIAVAGLLLIPCLIAAGQKKAAKTPPAKSAPTLDQLVFAGKIPEAVRLATKTPESVNALLKGTFAQVDVQITDRKLPQAQTALESIDKFLSAYGAANKGKEISADAVKGRILRIQGIQLTDQKQYAKSEEVLRKALEFSKKANDGTLEGGIHNNLGVALQSQTQPEGEVKLEAAAREFDAARQIAEEQKDVLRGAAYNFNLGRALQRLNRPTPALEALRRSAEQSKSASKPDIEARAILYQGVSLGIINIAGDEALKYFTLAERMFESQGDNVNAAGSYRLMADHMAYQGKFPEAAAAGERAIPLFTAAADKARLLECYEFLVDMYNRSKAPEDKEKAEKFKKLADELRKQSGE
jgi:tetratricopeptide (TPR) repeat protein